MTYIYKLTKRLRWTLLHDLAFIFGISLALAMAIFILIVPFIYNV